MSSTLTGLTILEIADSQGGYPVKEFLKEQNEVTYAKVLLAIRLLANNGPFLKPPYIKKLQTEK